MVSSTTCKKHKEHAIITAIEAGQSELLKSQKALTMIGMDNKNWRHPKSRMLSHHFLWLFGILDSVDGLAEMASCRMWATEVMEMCDAGEMNSEGCSWLRVLPAASGLRSSGHKEGLGWLLERSWRIKLKFSGLLWVSWLDYQNGHWGWTALGCWGLVAWCPRCYIRHEWTGSRLRWRKRRLTSLECLSPPEVIKDHYRYTILNKSHWWDNIWLWITDLVSYGWPSAPELNGELWLFERDSKSVTGPMRSYSQRLSCLV